MHSRSSHGSALIHLLQHACDDTQTARLLLFPPQARHASDLSDLEALLQAHGRQDVRHRPRQQGLPAARRTDHEKVVSPGGGDLNGASCGRLSMDVGELYLGLFTMAAHLEAVVAERPFVRTGRLQYARSTSVGDRHILAPSTYGFVDAIYSNGLVHTFESLYRTSRLLLSSFGVMPGPARVGDFSASALSSIDDLHRAQWKDADRMASSAYVAMQHPNTWSAWTQAWLAQVLFSDLWLQRACFRFFEAGEVAELDRLMEGDRPNAGSPLGPTRERLLDDLSSLLEGPGSGEERAEQMLARLRAEEWMPRHVYDWGDAAARSIDFSRPEVAGALLEWGFTASPPHLRTGLFDFTLPGPPPG